MLCIWDPFKWSGQKKPMLRLKIKITNTNKTIKNLLKKNQKIKYNNKKLTNYIIRDDRGDCPPVGKPLTG